MYLHEAHNYVEPSTKERVITCEFRTSGGEGYRVRVLNNVLDVFLFRYDSAMEPARIRDLADRLDDLKLSLERKYGEDRKGGISYGYLTPLVEETGHRRQYLATILGGGDKLRSIADMLEEENED